MVPAGIDINTVDPCFADSGAELELSNYVLFGAPFDATVSHRPGAAKAPRAIRLESYNFETYLMDLDVELQDVNICDLGDLSLPNMEEEQSEVRRMIRVLTGSIMDEDKISMMMGGEHSVTEGAVDAFMKKYARQGGLVVIVDAHLDFRNEYMGNPHSHACTSRRIADKWGTDSMCIIGARSACREEMKAAEDMGLRYVTARKVRSQGIIDIFDQWDTGFSIRDRPIYLSIDIDGMDPSFAPGTGTPEPWGISSFHVLSVLEGLYTNLRAMDVVEVSPDIESFITPGLAGKLIRQVIGLKEMKIKNPTWLEKI
ncbi:MAG: agmatinase [Candidatus Thermoplasmatota archaeon]|nr:agmatinase [Candidatus Thermoplasmatota archaeon]